MQYQLLFNDGQQASLSERLQAIRNLTTEYKTVQTAIKDKTAQRKALLAEQAELSPLQFIRFSQISQEVAALTEDIEELRFRKEQLLASIPDGDMKSMARQKKALATSMTKLEEQHAHLSAQKDNARADYDATFAEVDAAALTAVQAERAALRAEHRESITQRLQGTYGKHYRPGLLRKAERMIDTELGDQPAAEERRSLREQLNTHKQTQEHHPDKKEHDHARGR